MHDREAQSSAREVHALPGPKAFLFVRPATCLLGVTMRNKFQNKISSFDSMRDVLADEANLKAVNSNQGFKDETEDFRNTRAVLQPFLQSAANNTKGITANKKRLRAVLIKQLVTLAGGGFGYARKIGNTELQTAMNTSMSHWTRMRGGDIETQAQNLHDRLEVIVAGDAIAASVPKLPISNYQVTTQALTDLQMAIDALSLVEHGARAQKGMIGGANKQIQTLIFQLDEKKEILRRLLPQLEETFPQFVEAMKTAMMIVDSVATRTAEKSEDTPAKT